MHIASSIVLHAACYMHLAFPSSFMHHASFVKRGSKFNMLYATCFMPKKRGRISASNMHHAIFNNLYFAHPAADIHRFSNYTMTASRSSMYLLPVPKQHAPITLPYDFVSKFVNESVQMTSHHAGEPDRTPSAKNGTSSTEHHSPKGGIIGGCLDIKVNTKAMLVNWDVCKDYRNISGI